MKSIKIILAVIVIAVIGFFAVRSLVNIGPTGAVVLPKNQFTTRIELEIDSLGKLSDSKFCKEFYREVDYHINDYYKGNRFSVNQSDNKQWRDNLLKNLYSAYTDKFIRQAFYVFGRDEWKVKDLQFICSEYQIAHPCLNRGHQLIGNLRKSKQFSGNTMRLFVLFLSAEVLDIRHQVYQTVFR
jgi:hypothetical protein